MRVLLVGSGGREHALGWKLARSPRVSELMSLPGNPGLAGLGPVIDGIPPTDVGAVAALSRLHKVDLVVVGPEAPLAAGLVDAVSALGIPVFGPTRMAARLESSKSFAKEVMAHAGVATARAETFADREAARSYLSRVPGPYVVKADGLAGGKGVLVSRSRVEAEEWIDRCFDGGFGSAGSSVLIEEYLDGPELSVFAVCTPKGAVALEPARDYKRLRDGDQGPNTGGMGSYSPVEGLPGGLMGDVMASLIEPVLAHMEADGHPYTGFLYAGLVLAADGPKVLEFNVRLGDPEVQVVLPRMESDLIDLLEGGSPLWSAQAAVNVVLAAAGYPESPVTGSVIQGLDDVPDDVLVFHAGTAYEDGKLVVAGGRVLNLVGVGTTLEEARSRAYLGAAQVHWPGIQMRSDIGVASLP